MVAREQTPNGCAMCGLEERPHGQRWSSRIGWHRWIEPSDMVRLARMVFRRGVRQALARVGAR